MLEKPYTVMVTGASGWIGRNVCAWLQAHGVGVIAVLRRPQPGPWDDTCIAELADFGDPGLDLIRCLSRSQAMVHCAAHVHRPLENQRERSHFHAVNANGTRAVIRACVRHGVRRIVYTSTIAGYDWPAAGPDGYDERGFIDPASIYATTKLHGEQTLQDSDADWRILRLATVFGVGDRANFSKMAAAMARRRFVLPGPGLARKSVLALPLAAELIGRMVLLDSPRHRLINAALPIAPTLGEICAAFTEVCGLPEVLHVPPRILWTAGRWGDVIASILGRCPLTTGTVSRLMTPTVVRAERMQENFPDIVWPTFAEALVQAREYYRSPRRSRTAATEPVQIPTATVQRAAMPPPAVVHAAERRP